MAGVGVFTDASDVLIYMADEDVVGGVLGYPPPPGVDLDILWICAHEPVVGEVACATHMAVVLDEYRRLRERVQDGVVRVAA